MTTLTVEWAVNLTPVNEARRCRHCKEWTWWREPKQRTLGCCPTCEPGYWTTIPTEQQVTDAVLTLLDAFEGAEVRELDPRAELVDAATFVPERHEVTVTVRWLVSGQVQTINASMVDLTVGPCVRCYRSIRRYGPRGRTHCLDCALVLEKERYYATHPEEKVTDEFSDQVKAAGL